MAKQQLPLHETEVITDLDDKVTLDQAAKILDKSGSRVRQMIEGGNFKRVWRLGTRPTYLLDRQECQELADMTRSTRP